MSDTSPCPQCQRPVPIPPGKDRSDVLPCRRCGYGIVRDAPPGEAVVAREGKDETPPEALMRVMRPPRGLTVEADDDALVIRRRWWETNSRNLLLWLWVFCWDGFLVVWYLGAISGLTGDDGWVKLVAIVGLLFPLLHLAAGIYMTYWATAKLVNTTILRVADGKAEVTHGPLPAKGVAPIGAAAIEQVYVTRRETHNDLAKGPFEVVLRLGRHHHQVMPSGLLRPGD